MQLHTVKNILEAILLSVDKPMDVRQLESLFQADEDDRPSKDQILQALLALQADYQDRGMELMEVSSGYRIQVRETYTGWVSRLWEEKAPRYSRALLETLVLIAYRQPITRGEIEEIRGVSVSSHIMKTLLEREWVRVLGHKDVPGKPSMYGTTSIFLDYFNLKSLDELPALSDIKDLDKLHPSLELGDEPDTKQDESSAAETTSDEVAEEDSDAEAGNDASDTTDDSLEIGAEQADEDVDEKLEQEKLAVSKSTVDSDDMDDSDDLDSSDDELPEQNASPDPEEPEMPQSEEMADAEATEAEIDFAAGDRDEFTDAAQESVEDTAENIAESPEPEEQMASTPSDEPNELVDAQSEPDEPLTDEAETNELDAVTEEVEGEVEIDSEADHPDEAEAAADDSEATDVDDSEQVEEPEQQKQVQSYELPEAVDMDDVESVDELPEPQDTESKPERGGWSRLAQLVWERLKRLMQKARKRLVVDWNPNPNLPGLLNF